MKKIISTLGVCLWVALCGCGNSPTSSGKTLVNVNGNKITEGYLQFLGSINPTLAHQIATPFGKKEILDNLLEQELLYQASKKEGIHRDPMVQAKIDLYKKVILAQSYVDAQAEKEAKKYYDDHKQEFERLKLSHIMIGYVSPEEIKAAAKAKQPGAKKRTEQEALQLANQIYDELKKGGKFEEAAKKYSDDTSSKDNGGSLGDLSRNDPRLAMRGLQPLAEKAFEMKVGEIGGPVKTTLGYHILTVTAPAEMAPFEAIKDQLVFKTRNEMRQKLVADLKAKSKIVYADEVKPAEEKSVEELNKVPHAEPLDSAKQAAGQQQPQLQQPPKPAPKE